MVSVADHQAATVLIEVVGELVDVGGNPRSAAASIFRAPSRTISSSSSPPALVVGLVVLVYYREHGRTFPPALAR
ncbi:hypothetical protein LQL77_32395 [Rhodococcus cerastii]|nr:hypothetical protein [Rhodococcus cerastii]